jgi:hypothetical protein
LVRDDALWTGWRVSDLVAAFWGRYLCRFGFNWHELNLFWWCWDVLIFPYIFWSSLGNEEPLLIKSRSTFTSDQNNFDLKSVLN